MLRSCFSSIRVRLIFLVLLGIVPALGLLFYTAVEQHDLAATSVHNEAVRLAHLVAEDLKELIEETEGLLIVLAQLPSVRNRNSEQCNELFRALLKHYGDHYTNLKAIGSDGSTFCSAIPLAQPFNAAHEPWFQEAMQNRGFTLGGYRMSRVSGKAEVTLTYPVIGDGGQIQALVLAGLDINRIKHLTRDVQLPAGSGAMLIDRKGIILARDLDSKRLVGQSFPNASLVGIIGEQREGTAEFTTARGIPRLYAFTHVGVHPRYSDVAVIVGISKQSVFAQADWTLKRNLILFGLVGLLAIAVAWMGGNLFIVTPVSSLAMATERLATGDLSVRTGPPYQDGELGKLQHAFDKMAETLQMRQADARQAEEQQRGSREQLRSLASHLQSVREEERTLVAREIHDELGQTLTGLKIDLSWLARRLDANQNSLREKTQPMLELVDKTIQIVRRISTELRPGVLDSLGLVAAIEWQIHEFQNRTGTICEYSLPTNDPLIDETASTAMFRIFQETLTNVARHAGATKVNVTLQETDGATTLQVTDNGRGISESKLSDPRSLGLLGMRERALLLGGDFTIHRNDEGGTTVTVRIPLCRPEETTKSRYD